MATEVSLALENPVAYWNLTFNEKGELAESSFFQKVVHYLTSYVSSSHQENLRARLIEIIEASTCEDITLGKVAALAKNKRSWMYQLPTTLPHLVDMMYVKEEVQTFPGQIVPILDQGRYYNTLDERLLPQFFETQRLLFVGTYDPVTRLENLDETVRVEARPVARHESLDPLITWIGHACLLIQVGGVNILTDPSFSFVFPCFKRHVPPGIARQDLPHIDLILNSHNHGDHANEIERFAPFNPLVFCGARAGSWLQKMGFERPVEHDWWQQTTVTKEGVTLKITAVPAQHGSQLGLCDANQMLWCGYVIEVGDRKLYFAGDTAMGHHMVDEERNEHKLFPQIRERFGKIDLVFMPIAPEGESLVHTDHKEALDALEELGAEELIPIHWGAYRTGKEAIEDPLFAFQAEVKKRSLESRVRILKVGESYLLKEAAAEAIA